MPTVADRNLNPGNLKDPSTGSFRTFGSHQEGYAALLNDLQSKMTGTTSTGLGPSSTLADFSKTYAPPSDNNDSAQYAANLANTLGVRPDAQLGSLKDRIGDMAQAIARNEGYTPAKSFQSQAQPEQTPLGIGPQTVQADAGGAEKESLAQKALNFAFPIIKDLQHPENTTALQKLGDLGLSALWFVPGLGEVGGLVRGAGLAAKIGLRAGEGAALGYGADVASKLSQGKTGGEVFKPGLGTAVGGIAGPVVSRLAKPLERNLTQSGARQAVLENLTNELGRTAPTRNLIANLGNKASKAIDLLVDSGAAKKIGIDGNTFHVDDAVEELQKRIGALGHLRGEALDSMGISTSLDDLANLSKTVPLPTLDIETGLMEGGIQAALRRALTGKSAKMMSETESIINDFKQSLPSFGWDIKNLKPSELELLKEVTGAQSKIYKQTGQIGEANALSLLHDTAKARIEKIAADSGFPHMKEYTQYMHDHYNAIKLLERLRNQTVKGGRLGNMLRSHAMGTIGAVAFGMGGGGIMGSLLAGLAGEGAGGLLGKIMGDTSITNPLRSMILKNAPSKNTPLIDKLLSFTGKKGEVAPILKTSPSKGAEWAKSLTTKGLIRAFGQ